MANNIGPFEAPDSGRELAARVVALFHFKATGFVHGVSLIRNVDLAVSFFSQSAEAAFSNG